MVMLELKKMNPLVNIPKPITVNNYTKTVSKITKVVTDKKN